MRRRLHRVTAIVVGLVVIAASAVAVFPMPTVWAAEGVQAQQVNLININTAPVEQLATLKGIGEKMAQAIVEYRTANGPFKTVEDLMKVKGVGEKKFEAIKGMITVK